MAYSLTFLLFVVLLKDRVNYGNAQESMPAAGIGNIHVTPDTTSTASPCDPYEPRKPDFSAPKRRISTIKCYDTIWELKYREEKEERDDACLLEKLRRIGAFGVLAGRDTSSGEFPHMAAVGWKAVVGTWIFKCGGSLISSNFVLTAAHCTQASSADTTLADPVPKIVRLGDKNIIDTFSNGLQPTDVNISRIIVHPKYSSPVKYYDIALFELEQETVFNKFIHPACLWSNADENSVSGQAYVTGWGVVESGAKQTSPNLQAALVDTIDSATCDSLLHPFCYRNWCGIHEDQICAGWLGGGADTCQGDSGGPLSISIRLPASSKWALHYVVGITSFGFQCGQANSPGVYTRVSSFLDWIEDVVWRKKNNKYVFLT